MRPLALGEILEAVNARPPTRAFDRPILRVSIDSRTSSAGDIFFAITGRHFDGHDFVVDALNKGADYAIVSQATRFAETPCADRIIVVDDTIAALGRLAAYYRTRLTARVIAVTGSNGKTTTKTMIRQILSGHMRGRCSPQSYNNNIGVPLSIFAGQSSDEYVVVEIGTNSPGEVDYLGSLTKPDIAVITTVSAAHLEGLKDLHGVVQEKLALLDHLNHKGTAIVNIDQSLVRERLAGRKHSTMVTFGRHRDADLRATDVRMIEQRISFLINGCKEIHMPIPGQHNAVNALAAYAVGRAMGLTDDHIIERLSSFQLPDMRMQLHRIGKMTVINDSYNANPASMRAAIDTLENMKATGRRVAIVGDMKDLGERAEALHQELGRIIAASDIDVLVGVGQYAQVICDSACSARRQGLEWHTSDSVDDLSRHIGKLVRPEDVILLKGSRALHLEKLLENFSAV